MPKTITQFHRGNGQMSRPNVKYPDVRKFTADYIAESQRKAALGNYPVPVIPWWRRLKVWELAVLVLGAVGITVAAWVSW